MTELRLLLYLREDGECSKQYENLVNPITLQMRATPRKKG